MKGRKKLSKNCSNIMHIKRFKISYTVKVPSNMFRWQPLPPSSGKSTFMNQNTAIVNYLIMHTVRFTSRPHQYWACWIQTSNTSEAAQHRGNPESSSWLVLACVYGCVCVCVFIYITPTTDALVWSPVPSSLFFRWFWRFGHVVHIPVLTYRVP